MKAKIYNKKKLLSLLILPFVAGNLTAKSTLAADTVYNPIAGEIVNVTGINDSYRIFTYAEEVSVILDAAAQINNDDSYPAVHLGTNATVDMLPGSQITSTNASGYATGVEFNNSYYSVDGALNQVSMDQAAISATATDGTAFGIYSGDPDNYNASNVTTQITLDNNSSITTTASSSYDYSYAAGIYLAYGGGSRSVIELNHGSSISASATVTPAIDDSALALAQGIHIYDQEDTLIILDNGAGIEVTATATASGTGNALVYYTYGIYAESGYGGDSVVTMNNGSFISGTATATADQYAYIGDRYNNSDQYYDNIGGNSGIKVWNEYDGDANVSIANASSIINLSTATVNNTGTPYATTARVTDSFGIYAYSYEGNSSASLDSGSTITIDAIAVNNNLGSSNDRAYATSIKVINAYSYYGASTVTLNNLSAISVTSSATAQDNALAEAVGVQAGAYYDATVTMGLGSQITASATAAANHGSELLWDGANSQAQAQGIDTYSSSGNASVLLNNSSLDATAQSTITVAAADYAYYSGAKAKAYGIYTGADYGNSTITLNNLSAVTITATATNDSSAGADYSHDNSAAAYAYGIGAHSDSGPAIVSLNNASLATTATATAMGNAYSYNSGASANAYGIGAESWSGQANVDLYSSTVTAGATATGDALTNAYGTGIEASNSNYGIYGTAGSTVTLDASSVTVTTTATSTGAGGDFAPSAKAEATGIYTQTQGSTYNAEVTISNLSQVTAEAAATAAAGQAEADAYGIYAKSHYSETNITVSLNSTVDATATATSTATEYGDASAQASGISADGAEGAVIVLTDSTLTGSATATSEAGTAMAYAYGIELRAGNTSTVTLDNATITTAATATGSINALPPVIPDAVVPARVAFGTRAEASGISASDNSGTGSTTINLDNSSVSAMASATYGRNYAEATGIDIYALSTAEVNLTNSTVNASAYAQGDYGIAHAAGIFASGNGGNVLTTITLDNSSASAMADTDYVANATGISAGLGDSVSINLLNGASVNATTSGYHTEAIGIDIYDVNTGAVNLTNSSITATASAQNDTDYAFARGIATSDYFGAGSNTISLDNSSINATADASSGAAAGITADRGYSATINLLNGASINASASGNDSYAAGIAISGVGTTIVNLANATVSASTLSVGGYADGIVASGYDGTESTSITLDNSSVSAMAVSDLMAVATGITADFGDNVTLDLLNGASVNAISSGYSARATGLDIFYFNTATVNLTGAAINATANGYSAEATGINIYGVTNASINIDAASSVSGSTYAILAQNTSTATVNNFGLINGRVMVTDLNNQATGTLQATLAAGDSEWVDPLSVTPLVGNYYFTATDTASLVTGSTFQIATSDDLGFTEVGQIKEYRLLGTAVDGGTWDPATLNVVKTGYQSPLLRLYFSYSDPNNVETPGLSDDDHYILRVEFLAPATAGLTPNAAAAAAAALADGLFTFNSDPEQWSPEIMSRVFGTMQFIHGNLNNIGNRLHGKKSGENSGNPAANNNLWGSANYTDATQDMRDNIEGFDSETMAFNLGYDRNLSANALLGISLGYGTTEAETEFNHRTQEMDEYMLSLYGQVKGQGWFGEGQLAAGWGSTDSVRNVGSTLYTASFDSNSYYAKLVGGMNIDAGGWALIPKASIDYANISFDDYQEVGGPLALAVSSDTYDSSNLGAGLSVMNKGKMFTPEFGAMVYYDLIGDTIQTSSRFTGGATYFQTEGADPARLSWELNAGLTFEAPGTPLTFKVGYDLLGREDFMSHNFNGKLTFDF